MVEKKRGTIFDEMNLDASEGATNSVEATVDTEAQLEALGLALAEIQAQAEEAIRNALRTGNYFHPDTLPVDINSINFFGEGPGKETL